MIYLNLTVLLPGGKAQGITRILRELTREVLHSRPDVAFIATDPESDCTVRLTRHEAELLSKGQRLHLSDHTASNLVKPIRKVTPSSIYYPLQSRLKSKLTVQRERLVRFTAADVLVEVGLPLWPTPALKPHQEAQAAGARLLVYLHDLIPIIRPQYTSVATTQAFSQFIKLIAQESNTIICNSKCTRADFEAWLAEESRSVAHISTVTPAFELPALKVAGAVSDRVLQVINRRYILCVSTIECRKNHDVLYKALVDHLESGGNSEDFPLMVFVGRQGWFVDDLLHDLQHDPRVKNRIVMLHDVDDTELRTLYERCLFTVFPSFYEGWGLPVSESLLFGKFVLSSDRGSLPEAASGMAELLSPYDTRLWKEKILSYAIDRARLAQREQQIQLEFQPRHWGQFCAEFIERLQIFHDERRLQQRKHEQAITQAHKTLVANAQ